MGAPRSAARRAAPTGSWKSASLSPTLTFRQLQARAGEVSSSVLNDRLRELREVKIIATRRGGGYLLTADGQELLTALAPLDAWAERWANRSTD
jgi:DNA-binding HxlR family transcriptional regulator